MRLNNIKAKKFVISMYFAFVVLLVFGVLSFSFVSQIIGNARLKYLAVFFVLLIVFLIVYRAAKYFEYDSDGNVLVIVNKDLLLSEFINLKERRAEFPKKKLLYYKINNYGFYRSLNLYITSKENKQKRLKFNITLLSNKKVDYLKQSLNKVVKQNKAKR